MINSFKYAINGIKDALISEDNLAFHFIASIFVIIFAYFFKFSAIEFALIIIAIFFVIVAEIVNTIIEKLSDVVHPDYSEKIRKIKDMSAAVVLLSSICSLIVAVLLFVPKL